MKRLLKFFILFSCLIPISFASLNAQTNSAPIQNGTSLYTGELYHMSNVGISLNDPNAKLHIEYDKYDEANPARVGVPFLIDGLFKQIPPAGQTSLFQPRTYFKVAGNGFVGIGTNNPSELLHIYGGLARFETSFGYADLGANDGAFFRFMTELPAFHFNQPLVVAGSYSRFESDYGYLSLHSNVNGYLNLETNLPSFYFNKEIVADGDVHIAGDAFVDGEMHIESGVVTSTLGELKLQTNGVTKVTLDNNTNDVFINGGNVKLQSSTGTTNLTITQDGKIASANNNIVLHTGGEDKLVVDNTTGNVLINGGRLIVRNANGLGTGINQIALNGNGTIRAREVKVDLQIIPDYVFDKDYNLMSLDELRTFVEQNQHLPNIKSEEEFIEQGDYSLGEMNVKLLEKVEELTLYILQLEERIDQLEKK